MKYTSCFLLFFGIIVPFSQNNYVLNCMYVYDKLMMLDHFVIWRCQISWSSIGVYIAKEMMVYEK